ncbi:MAG: hypothetical protein ACRDUT_03185 [Mycobacterium sp.]
MRPVATPTQLLAAIVTSPEVAEIGVHRAAGLDGQLLIRVTQLAR